MPQELEKHFKIVLEFQDKASGTFKVANNAVVTAAANTTKFTSGLNADLKTASKTFDSTGMAMTGFGTGATKTCDAMRAIGTTVKWLVGLAAFREVTRWMSDTIRLSAEQQNAVTKMNAALAATGKYSPEVSQSLQNFASDLQNVTTVSNDMSMTMMGTIATLTDLDAKGISQAQKAAIGIAKTFSMDLNSASELVAKTIGSQTNALSRWGIEVKRTLPQQEKLNILTEKTAAMYKIAEAETKTYTGGVVQLKNVYSEWRAEMGKAVTENQTVITAINLAKNAFANSMDSMGGNVSAFQIIVSDMVIASVDGLLLLVKAIGFVNTAMANWRQWRSGLTMSQDTAKIEGYEEMLKWVKKTKEEKVTSTQPWWDLSDATDRKWGTHTEWIDWRNQIPFMMRRPMYGWNELEGLGKAQAIDKLNKMIADQGPVIARSTDAWDANNKAVDDTVNAWESMVQELETARSTLESTRGQTTKNIIANADFKKSLDDITDSAEKADEAYKDALKGITDSIEEMLTQESLTKFLTDKYWENYSDNLRSIHDAQDRWNDSLEDTKKLQQWMIENNIPTAGAGTLGATIPQFDPDALGIKSLGEIYNSTFIPPGSAWSGDKGFIDFNADALQAGVEGTVIKPELDVASMSLQFATAISEAFKSSDVKSSIGQIGSILAQGLNVSQEAGWFGMAAGSANPWIAGIGLVTSIIGRLIKDSKPKETKVQDVRVVNSDEFLTKMFGSSIWRLLSQANDRQGINDVLYRENQMNAYQRG